MPKRAPTPEDRAAPVRTPAQQEARRLRRSWHPDNVQRTVHAIAHRILLKWTHNRSAASKVAQAIGQACATRWIGATRHALNLHGFTTPIPWLDVSLALAPQPGDRTIPPAPTISHTSAVDSIQSESVPGCASVPVAVAPPAPKPTSDSTIERGEIVRLLKSLLVRAQDGEMSAGDSVRLADTVAKIEGIGRSERNIQVNLVLYDPGAYAQLLQRQ